MAERVKKWKVLPSWEGERPKLPLPSFAYDLFLSRGITTEQEIYSFLEADYKNLYDPLFFINMEEAVKRVRLAKEKGERVLIYGDYDVDGITATALMFECLNNIGVQNVETYIPHREEEGYGLNQSALTEIKKRADLIITVDCGITSRELVDSMDLDFIICDHHEIDSSRVPEKAIILHPQLVTEGNLPLALSACGMAFFFAKAIGEEFSVAKGQEKWLLDFVALATICDIVPLVSQNRILAKWGLLVLSKTKRVGLVELMKNAGIKQEEVSSFAVGFLLGPRLNASGRLAHAKKSLELLLTKDKNEATDIAAELNKLNTERQEQCARILEEAKTEIASSKKSENEIILIANRDWPRGVVGIIASRVLEIYNRPVIVFENDGELLHGSARSVDAFDVTEALSSCKAHLIKFGGHAKAAGLTLKKEDFANFEKEIIAIAKKKINKEEMERELPIDAMLTEDDLTNESLDFLEKMEPFGFGNKTPIFAINNMNLRGIKRVGSNKEHLKFKIGKAGIDAIFFNFPEEVTEDENYDIAFTLKYNNWNNLKRIDMRVIDMKKIETAEKREVLSA